jgi:hypothetical protein
VTFIIELVFILGFSLSIDATQLYGIDNREDCNRMLPMIIHEYEADRGSCLRGDILKKSIGV